MPSKKRAMTIKKTQSQKMAPTQTQTLSKHEEEEGAQSKYPELLRGFRDILPEEQGKWNLVRDTVRKFAEAY